MPFRTQIFKMLPWDGGLNTTMDEGMIPSNQCTVLDNVLIGGANSKLTRPGIDHSWDGSAANSSLIIGAHDYWHGTTSKIQRLVSVASDRSLYAYNAGVRTTLTDSGTAWTGTLDTSSMLTFNNQCIIAVSGSTNVLKMWDGSTNVVNVPGSPPNASILREHLGRIFCNNSANPDRLYYSPTNDHTKWNGVADSGAINVRIGDGDPEGITAIFPPFKGSLFVAKKTKLYRISGNTPETFIVTQVSDGIGCVSHNSVIATEDDIYFVSERGVHSLAATVAFGDVTTSFVSFDIQKTFNEQLNRSHLKYVWGSYLDSANSLAFTFSEQAAQNRVNTTSSVNNAIYLFNIPKKAWYRWPDLSCQSMVISNDADQKRLYLGTHTGKVSKSFIGTRYDINAAGAKVAVREKIVTGRIHVDGDPYTLKAYKRLILFFQPKGTYNFSAGVTIDNTPLNPENNLSFSGMGGGTPLGLGFKLGRTPLGATGIFGPQVRQIDGYGHNVKISIEQTALNSESEIQGLAIEWEPVGQTFESIE
jgi:hypothetical protein